LRRSSSAFGRLASDEAPGGLVGNALEGEAAAFSRQRTTGRPINLAA
jgi:hypothetical protein